MFLLQDATVDRSVQPLPWSSASPTTGLLQGKEMSHDEVSLIPSHAGNALFQTLNTHFLTKNPPWPNSDRPEILICHCR